MKVAKQELAPFGYEIASDGEMISLTDIWKASGKSESYKPAEWLRINSTIQLIDALMGVLVVGNTHLIKVQKGKNAKTFAHKQIALAYAKYLDPKLHVAVNQIFFERLEEEKNPDLILDRAVHTYKKRGKSDKWIGERLKGKATRIDFTRTLAEHEVTGIGFKNCTNAIYKPLWGGDATLIRTKKGLPEKANTRESMTDVELAAVGLAELLAQKNIEDNNITGNKNCESICLNVSTIVAQSVKQGLKKI